MCPAVRRRSRAGRSAGLKRSREQYRSAAAPSAPLRASYELSATARLRSAGGSRPEPGWFESGYRRQRRSGGWSLGVAAWGRAGLQAVSDGEAAVCQGFAARGQAGLGRAAGGSDGAVACFRGGVAGSGVVSVGVRAGSDGGRCGGGRGVRPGPELSELARLRGRSGSDSGSGGGSGGVWGAVGAAGRAVRRPGSSRNRSRSRTWSWCRFGWTGRGGVCRSGGFAECRGRCALPLGVAMLGVCRCGRVHVRCHLLPVLRTADCDLPTANCQLPIAYCRLRSVGVPGVSFP